MNTNFKVALALVAGTAFGAVAVHGLHAQGKPKAYTITESETIDAAAQAQYTPLIQAAIKAAGGRNFNTAGGRVVALEGAAAPKRAAINEWDSLEQAQAFFNSPGFKNLTPQQTKANRTIRRYIVEAVN